MRDGPGPNELYEQADKRAVSGPRLQNMRARTEFPPLSFFSGSFFSRRRRAPRQVQGLHGAAPRLAPAQAPLLEGPPPPRRAPPPPLLRPRAPRAGCLVRAPWWPHAAVLAAGSGRDACRWGDSAQIGANRSDYRELVSASQEDEPDGCHLKAADCAGRHPRV